MNIPPLPIILPEKLPALMREYLIKIKEIDIDSLAYILVNPDEAKYGIVLKNMKYISFSKIELNDYFLLKRKEKIEKIKSLI